MKFFNKFKAFICASLIASCMCSLVACSSKEVSKKAVLDVDGASLIEDMQSAATDLPDMGLVSSSTDDAEDLFSSLCDLDYSLVDSFYYAYSTDSDRPQYEIAVVILKSSDDTSDLVKALKAHVSKRVTLFETYVPEAVETAENAVVKSSVNVACLIMTDNNSLVESVFNAAVNK